VTGLTKHQGQSTHNYRYDAYGQLLPAKGNWTDPHPALRFSRAGNHYTFSGKEWDEHLDSYEFGYRLIEKRHGISESGFVRFLLERLAYGANGL